MLIYLLGAIDILATLILLFGRILHLDYYFFIFFAILLLAKSLMGLLKDFASWIDFVGGILLILSIPFGLPLAVRIIISLFLVQKAIFSFIGSD